MAKVRNVTITEEIPESISILFIPAIPEKDLEAETEIVIKQHTKYDDTGTPVEVSTSHRISLTQLTTSQQADVLKAVSVLLDTLN